MIELKFATADEWVDGVVADMDRFLPDHAAAEKKASGMAMTMVSHYPDRIRLVDEMMDLALEELSHFRAVVKIMHERGLTLLPDEKDAYVNQLRAEIRTGREQFFLDRMLVAGVIEARGAERFGLIAEALPSGSLKRFYRSITRSELQHQGMFIELANHYFDARKVGERLNELLRAEARIVEALPVRVALH